MKKAVNSQAFVPYGFKWTEIPHAFAEEQNKETVPCSIIEKSKANSPKCIVFPETIENELETQCSKLFVVEETPTQNISEELVPREFCRGNNFEIQTSAEENVPKSNEFLKPRLHDKETLTEATKCLFNPGTEYQSVSSLRNKLEYWIPP